MPALSHLDIRAQALLVALGAFVLSFVLEVVAGMTELPSPNLYGGSALAFAPLERGIHWPMLDVYGFTTASLVLPSLLSALVFAWLAYAVSRSADPMESTALGLCAGAALFNAFARLNAGGVVDYLWVRVDAGGLHRLQPR